MENIFIDIDNVIADFEASFRRFLNKKTGKRLRRDEITEFQFYKSFKISEEQEREIYREFTERKGHERLTAIKGCKRSINHLQEICKVSFITSRPVSLRKVTLSWLRENGIKLNDEDLIFTKNKADEKYDMDVIVEDKWEDAEELAERGKIAILLDYPWNRRRDECGNIKIKRNILRVYSWADVEAKIEEIVEDRREEIGSNQSILSVWQEAIRVQMHFNEMIMRNRATFASIIFAAFGAALAVQKWSVNGVNKGAQVSNWILALAAIGIVSYFWIDTKYYFKLLLGAVKYAEQLDRKYRGIGLTTAISKSIKHGQARRSLIIFYLIILAGLIAVVLIRPII